MDSGRLKAMTFNIRYGTAEDGPHSWPYRRDAVLSFLKTSGCDLIGLQEVLAFQLEEIISACPFYKWIGVGREDGLDDGEYAAILFDSRRVELISWGSFWFSDIPDMPGSSSWGNRCTRICTHGTFEVDGVTLDHYNLHIDHESAASRLRSIELLRSRLATRQNRLPCVVTGDFNAGETSPPILLMRAAGYTDAFRTVHPNNPEVTTYHDWTGTTDGQKIDYIFVDGLSVIDSSIVRDCPSGQYLSDHYPVVATLVLTG